ncbi:MAG TPA: hypothetical protein VEV81_05540, partial [Pyrinomonadaceae bacterium]|nr:hypothetical protein [Pyrinomonadaceae bacterium]
MTTRIRSRLVGGCLLAIVAVVGANLVAQHNPAGQGAPKSVAAENLLVVHEWGTFTSIAGRDGVALEWRPLNGSTDLPKFVHTIQSEEKGIRHGISKDNLVARIRMETPVLYFYSASETDVSVKVDFPKG